MSITVKWYSGKDKVWNAQSKVTIWPKLLSEWIQNQTLEQNYSFDNLSECQLWIVGD